jgi:hypothetical protein
MSKSHCKSRQFVSFWYRTIYFFVVENDAILAISWFRNKKIYSDENFADIGKQISKDVERHRDFSRVISGLIGRYRSCVGYHVWCTILEDIVPISSEI